MGFWDALLKAAKHFAYYFSRNFLSKVKTN